LRIKFQMFLRTLKIHPKNYLKFLHTKGDQLGIKKWYKKARSIKLLLGFPEKDYRSTRALWVNLIVQNLLHAKKQQVNRYGLMP